MPQHRLNRSPPLVLKASGQLLHHLLARHLAPPHLRLARLRVRKDPHQPVVAHPRQAQPGQVPAAVALRVGTHAAMGFGNNVRTEWIVPRKAAELHEELVARHVVDPGRSHGLLKGPCVSLGVAGRGNALDAAELRQGVDAVGVERVHQLLDGGPRRLLVSRRRAPGTHTAAASRSRHGWLIGYKANLGRNVESDAIVRLVCVVVAVAVVVVVIAVVAVVAAVVGCLEILSCRWDPKFISSVEV